MEIRNQEYSDLSPDEWISFDDVIYARVLRSDCVTRFSRIIYPEQAYNNVAHIVSRLHNNYHAYQQTIV